MNLNLTMAFQVLFFIVFVWFSKKFVWVPIIGALNERKTRIADALVAAEKGQMAEQEGRDQAMKVISEAKTQAGEIIGKAEKHGAKLVEEAKSDAKQEGARIMAATQVEIQTEINKAKESLRSQVSELAVAGAQQILKREIDGKTHARLLDELAAKL